MFCFFTLLQKFSITKIGASTTHLREGIHLGILFFLGKILNFFKFTMTLSGLLWSFDPPGALIFTPTTNLLPYEWIVSTTGKHTQSIKGPSRHEAFSAITGQCYRLTPLSTALIARYPELSSNDTWWSWITPCILTPITSFSRYAKSPGAGEYFWMSVSMYA